MKAIRDLAGAYVFDEKRATCSRKLFLGQAALKEIGEIVKTIENDISTLKQDKKLLKEFLQLEKSKKALEVVAKKGAQLEVQTKLHQVEASIEEKRRFLQETRKPLSNMWEEMNECQNGLKAITESITGCTENTAALTKDLDQKYAEKERLKLRMTEVVKQMEANEEKLSANGREEHAIVKQIETANRNYEATQAQWSEFSSIYENLDLQLKLRQSDQKFLYTRQDRLGAFRNLQERNSWILNEIQRVEGNLKDKNDQDKDWRKDLEDTVVQRASAEEEIGRCLENESEILAEIRQIKKDILDKTSQSKDMSQERQEIAKECLEMRKEIQILEDSQLDLENKLKSNPGMRDCVQGMKSIGLAVARLIEEGQDHLNESFHGPVADCLEWDPDVSECVNVVLGKRAFVCVVSTARVATQILRKLKELKLPGIFEFLPLDKVRSYKEMDYPEAMDAVPLISKVQPRAPQFEIVRRFYFNLWILVRHLETAHAFKGTKFHCITVSGDQTNSKGVMTGGYFNARRNNLLLYSQFFEKRMKGDELHAEVMERENNLQELGLRHEQLLADIQKDKSKAERLREKGMTQRENRLQYQQRLDNLVQSLKHTELKLTEIKSDLAQLNNEKDNLEKERDADPGESISQECVELSRDITDLLRHHKEAFKNKMEVERSRNDLSEQMRFLETKLAKIQESDTAEEIAHLNLELGASKEDYVRVRNQIRKDEEELEKMTQVTNKKCEEKCVLDKSRDALQGALEKMEEERQNMVNALDRDLAKKRDLEERAKDTASYSEGTGASEEEVAKVAHYTAKQCFSKMKQIDKKLRKKFGKVNKRADDQLALLLEKREQLESQRLTSLDESEQLQDLLDTTAGRCREKVEFTMRQVGKYFEEIFKTLVPDGYACLNIEEKLVRRSGNGSIASSSIGESGASSVDGDEDRGIEKVPVGVAVHVSFYL